MCKSIHGDLARDPQGTITCTGKLCKKTCEPGYQTYGGKSSVKCIRTKQVWSSPKV